MPQQIPPLPSPNNERRDAVRADAHLGRAGAATCLPTLTASQQALLQALVVPDRVGALPRYADRLDPGPVVEAAVAAGLISVLRDNARQGHLPRLVEAASHEAQRQRFVARERLLTARRAARTIARLTGEHPVALGTLAAASSVYDREVPRLYGTVVLGVAPRSLGTARRATADLRGVEIRSRPLRGRRRRTGNDAIWLRASGPTPDGWRVPSAEDQLLLAAQELRRTRGAARIGLLVDLLVVTGLSSLHWSTMAQRATLWRVRPATWDALNEVVVSFGTSLPRGPVEQLRPGVVERLRHLVAG